MGARTLEGRLRTRTLALAVSSVALVGALAVVVTDRTLAASDEHLARATAEGAHDALRAELAEGDSFAESARDVLAEPEAAGLRMTLVLPNGQRESTKGADLPHLRAGTCSVLDEEHGLPWLACAHGDAMMPVVAAVPLTSHRAAIGALWRAMGALVVGAAAALWFAVKRAVRGPLEELTALVVWARRVLETERAEAPPVAETAEVGALGTAFEGLVRELLDTLARERASSAHVAHELRTPLTAFAAELDALAARAPAERPAVARLRGDVERLADVIDAILVLSDRARAGPREIVNVADLARELTPEGAAVDAPDEALVEGDERLVRLALRNLLDNARRYGGGARRVRVEPLREGVRLAVIDEGVGLDEAARARMFDRYWRGAADGDGRGIGLALVRAVAERHGGRAEAVPGPGGRGLEVGMLLGPAIT